MPNDPKRRILRWQNLGEAFEPERSLPAPVPVGGSEEDDSAIGQRQAGTPDLVGCFDPLDGTELEEGERVVVCLSCGTGYHETSWTFLADHNYGACCNCKKTSDLSFVVLAGSASGVREDQHGQIVRMEDLRAHVGRVVMFEGVVLAHQISQSSGTHFIKFHVDKNPFKGFKLVIFSSEVHKWERRGVDPASYRHRVIQVRGLLKDHPAYGLEILPKAPAQIKVIK